MNDQITTEPKQRKKPGPRPRKHDTSGMTNRDMEQAGLSADPRETAAHEPDRPKRVSMQGAMKLSIPEGLIKPDYTARWFRDKDARVAQGWLLQSGWRGCGLLSEKGVRFIFNYPPPTNKPDTFFLITHRQQINLTPLVSDRRDSRGSSESPGCRSRASVLRSTPRRSRY